MPGFEICIKHRAVARYKPPHARVEDWSRQRLMIAAHLGSPPAPPARLQLLCCWPGCVAAELQGPPGSESDICWAPSRCWFRALGKRQLMQPMTRRDICHWAANGDVTLQQGPAGQLQQTMTLPSVIRCHTADDGSTHRQHNCPRTHAGDEHMPNWFLLTTPHHTTPPQL